MTRTAVVGLLAGLAAVGQAPTPMQGQPRGYVAHRAASPISIDGKLDDRPWTSARWSDAFVDIEGSAKPQPRYATRVKMLWDETYFYIGAELAEPHLWATLKEHDSVIFRDNDFEVFIDPNGDNHEYYELELNALATTWDLLLPKPYKDDGKAVNGWEIAGMKSAVSLDGTLNNPSDIDRGWSVELALPWKALGELARRPSPPADGDQWRVNFSRVEWQLEVINGAYRKKTADPSERSEPARTERGGGVPASERVGGLRGGEAPRQIKEANWVWSPQGVVDMHRPEHWGYVQFSTAPVGSVSFRPDASAPARDFLHSLYYAEREFRRVNKRWARTLEELKLRLPTGTGSESLSEPALAVAGDQFQASVTLVASAGVERWHIRQDSLIWRD